MFWLYLLGIVTFLFIVLRRVLRRQPPLSDELYIKKVAIDHVHSGVAWVPEDGKLGWMNPAHCAEGLDLARLVRPVCGRGTGAHARSLSPDAPHGQGVAPGARVTRRRHVRMVRRAAGGGPRSPDALRWTHLPDREPYPGRAYSRTAVPRSPFRFRLNWNTVT
jgi:hypothetical protein